MAAVEALAVVVLFLVVAALGAAVGVGFRRQRQLSGGPARTAIDPFTVGEPWRHVVAASLRARNQAAAAVAGTPAGPLRERLRGVEAQLDTALGECWAIARRGHELRRALGAMDLTVARSRLDALQARLDGEPDDAALASTAQALQAKLDSGERLRQATAVAEDRLRLLGARLEEASARIIELAARPETAVAELGGLGVDVEDLVLELEAVRQGLEAVAGPT